MKRLLKLSGIALAVFQSQSNAGRFTLLHSSIDAGGGASYSSRFAVNSSIGFIQAAPNPPLGHFQFATGAGVLNEAPVAEKDFLLLPASGDLNISTQSLTSNDRDPEGNPFTLSLPTTSTARGGHVELTNGIIRYTPSTTLGVTADFFTYNLTDTFGNQSIGKVNLVALAATPQLISVQKKSSGLIVRFQGSPNSSYLLQARPTLTASTIWRDYPDELQPFQQNSDATGICEFIIPIDSNRQFFRAADISSLKSLLTTTVQNGGKISITMRGSPGRIYKIQYRPTLNLTAIWADYPNPAGPLSIRAATDGFYTFTAPVSGQIGFYRTLVQ
jgi:hypothetical protein